MFCRFLVFVFINLGFIYTFASNEIEEKKSHIEDIFIWKMSDELKLSATEEKKFSEITKQLNKKKFELNKKIQNLVTDLNESSTEKNLLQYKNLIKEYNQISITEYEQIKKIFGTKKFISYLKIKNELNAKMKSIIAGDKTDKKDIVSPVLPKPKVIIEKSD